MKNFQAYGLMAVWLACLIHVEGAGVKTQQAHAGRGAALLVIDVQRGLFRQSTPVYEAAAFLCNLTGLVAAAHASGIPVVFVRHSNKWLVRHTEPWELHPALQPGANDLLLDKTHGDAFQATELDALLRARSAGTVYVSGLVTEGCVRATCLGALKRGYRVVLVADAHSSFHRDAANRIRYWNAWLAGKVAAVIPAGEVDFAAGSDQP